MTRGLVLVLSAPSGAGKSTLCQALAERRPETRLSISCTTRAPRPSEVNGRDYFFLSPREFAEKRESGEFLEWAEVHGHFYGTPRGPIDAHLGKGHDVLMNIDTQGARSVKQAMPDCVTVFIAPPSWSALEERLRRRNQDDEATIQRRLLGARREWGEAARYDYVVVNDDVENAVADLTAILRAERRRTTRVALDAAGPAF